LRKGDSKRNALINMETSLALWKIHKKLFKTGDLLALLCYKLRLSVSICRYDKIFINVSVLSVLSFKLQLYVKNVSPLKLYLETWIFASCNTLLLNVQIYTYVYYLYILIWDILCLSTLWMFCTCFLQLYSWRKCKRFGIHKSLILCVYILYTYMYILCICIHDYMNNLKFF